MADDEIQIGFFTPQAHYTLATTELPQSLEEDLKEIEPEYQDHRGIVTSYENTQEIIEDEINQEKLLSQIKEDYTFALAYLNGELQQELEENWGNNGVLIQENWPQQIQQKLETGEYTMEDFNLANGKLAITYEGENPENLRWSYMEDTFYERNPQVLTKGEKTKSQTI